MHQRCEGATPLLKRFLLTAQQHSTRRHHLAFGAALCLIVTACFYIGVVPTRQYGSDLMILADSGWRVLNGLRPHVDFASGHGPVTFLVSAAGIWLAGGSIDGVGYGDALISLAIGIWAYCVLVRRVGGALAVAGAVMTTLLSVAPAAPGESFRLSTHAMNYNRWGFAFLGVLIVEAFPLRSRARPGSFADGFSTGAICGILLFTKASFFGVAVVLALVSLLWRGRLEKRRLLGLVAGTVSSGFAFMAYLGFHAGAVIADLRMAADARAEALPNTWVLDIFAQNFPSFLILCVLALMSQMADPVDAGSSRLGRILNFRPLLLATIIYCGGVLLLCTNCQQERLPLNEILAVLFLDCILRGVIVVDMRYTGAMALVSLGLILGPAWNDAMAVANGVRLKRHAPTDLVSRPNAGGFSSAVFLDDYDPSHHGAFLADYLTDGVRLLHRESNPGEKITTFDTYNPFPYALGSRPPRGGMSCQFYHYHFNDRQHPTPEEFFGDADLVMYPKTPEQGPSEFAGLVKFYGSALETRFTVVAESTRWKLYRRTSAWSRAWDRQHSAESRSRSIVADHRSCHRQPPGPG